MYIAEHHLMVGGEIVRRGDEVKGLPQAEVARLLAMKAIKEKWVPIATKPGKPAKTEATDNADTPYSGKSPEEIAAMFRRITKAQLVEIAAENGLEGISEEMDKAEIVAAIVECGISV